MAREVTKMCAARQVFAAAAKRAWMRGKRVRKKPRARARPPGSASHFATPPPGRTVWQPTSSSTVGCWVRVEHALVDARVVGPLLLDAGRLSRNAPAAGYAVSSGHACAKWHWLLFAAEGGVGWVDRPSEGPLEKLRRGPDRHESSPRVCPLWAWTRLGLGPRSRPSETDGESGITFGYIVSKCDTWVSNRHGEAYAGVGHGR